MNLEAYGETDVEVPRELAGPPPRRVRLNLSTGDGRFLLGIVLCCFVGGSIALGWNCYDDFGQLLDRAALRTNHREALAEVTGFSFGRYSPMAVIYRFSVQGIPYTGEATEPNTPKSGTSFSKGDQITIRYLPSNPNVNHPDAWEWSPAIGWHYFVGELFFTVLGGLAAVVLWRDRRLARHGRAAAGVVVSCVRKDPSFHVEYQFRTEGGVSIRGDSESMDEYVAGARIWVLYLPQRPQRNHIYPMLYHSVTE